MDAGKAIRLAMMVAKSIGMPAKASGGEVTNPVSDEDMLKTHNAQRVGLGLPDGTCPEDMFNSEVNPNINHGAGAYQYSLEHIGDLVHRLSYTDRLGGGVGYGIHQHDQFVTRFLPRGICYFSERDIPPQDQVPKVRGVLVGQLGNADVEIAPVFLRLYPAAHLPFFIAFC